MKEVIWLSAGTKDVSPTVYYANCKLLANGVGGELVKFGVDGYVIIGDERAKKRLESIKNSK